MLEINDMAPSASGSTMTLAENRVALTVTELDDANVAKGMFERFGRRHGAGPARVAALHEVGRALGRALCHQAGGGLLEAERVGSFIEVRAVGRERSPEDVPEASLLAHDGELLALALHQMDGVEGNPTSSSRFLIRTWCGLD